MPNPLTDELTPEVKAELSAVFAEMRNRYECPCCQVGMSRLVESRTARLTGRRG